MSHRNPRRYRKMYGKKIQVDRPTFHNPCSLAKLYDQSIALNYLWPRTIDAYGERDVLFLRSSAIFLEDSWACILSRAICNSRSCASKITLSATNGGLEAK